jgi:hypothetical protein
LDDRFSRSLPIGIGLYDLYVFGKSLEIVVAKKLERIYKAKMSR